MVVRKRPILTITIKFFAICLVVLLGLNISDSKGIFDPNNKNNHTIKKWDAFYDFTQEHNVDILLVGNSHLYTGINPKNLSARLGANAFILASPGTHIGDTYYVLKEALTVTKPTHVVVETYGIESFKPYSLTEGALSDQFKSFSARRNKWVKLTSTPRLFSSENYGYAWSNTLRNHDYLLTNYAQIEKNTNSKTRFAKGKSDELYLGRFVRFSTGINDSILKRYKEKGAPVNGEDYQINDYAEYYTNQLVALCEAHNIQLIFLTLPMYKDHISNYAAWEAQLSQLILPTKQPWLNLQTSAFHDTFGPESFESTYNNNQHMTYNGSLIATHLLADYIEENSGTKGLPNRTSEPEWIDLFYGEEGYFDHHSPRENDTKHLLISQERKLNNITVREIAFVTNQRNKSILVKVDKAELSDTIDLTTCQLQLNVNFEMKGAKQNAIIPLMLDRYHTHPEYHIFKTSVKPIKIYEIVSGELVFL